MDSSFETCSKVLEKLRQENLYAKMSKCTFGASSVEYLGHQLTTDGISVDPKKLQVLKDWPKPTTKVDTQSFFEIRELLKKI